MASSFKTPGEHVYDGVVFCKIFPAATLDAVKKFKFKDDDVLIATYPKSGAVCFRAGVLLSNLMKQCSTLVFGQICMREKCCMMHLLCRLGWMEFTPVYKQLHCLAEVLDFDTIRHKLLRFCRDNVDAGNRGPGREEC